MTNPIILITGSTDGIGKATAFSLAKEGVEVILHGRNTEKGRAVQHELQKKVGGDKPDIVIADYESLDAIRLMASEVSSRYQRLDVLVNNVGTYQKTRQLTDDGFEMTFGVNYLGPFLLTHLLLPLLKRGAPSRIVTVASGAHEDVQRINWDNLQGEQSYSAWDAYALSKFADITFTYVLARKIEGSGVTANCLHPGVVDTKLLRSAFPGYPAISPDEGALTSVYLAVSPDVNNISGEYFDNQKPVRSSALTHERSVQKRLWRIANDMTEAAF